MAAAKAWAMAEVEGRVAEKGGESPNGLAEDRISEN
jgi:hypothetical protein